MTQATSVSQPRFCGNCGAPLLEGARFCGRCGRETKPPTATVAATPKAPSLPDAPPVPEALPSPPSRPILQAAPAAPPYAATVPVSPLPASSPPLTTGVNVAPPAQLPHLAGTGGSAAGSTPRIEVASLSPVASAGSHAGTAAYAPAYGHAPSEAQAFASFGSRAVAFIIDVGLVNIGTYMLAWLLGAMFDYSGPELFALAWLLWHPVGWLYFAYMQSSADQATVGKMALGLRVSRADGSRVSFLRATARFAGKYASVAVLGFGYLMAAFTQRKQALHDMIAGTIVVKAPR